MLAVLSRVLCLFLLSIIVTAVRDQPRLKPGRVAHTSHITRSKSHGRGVNVGLSLSPTESVTLVLEPNDDLLSPDYEEVEILPSGLAKQPLRRKADIPVCWYRGHIQGETGSNVIASDCDGMDGLIQRKDGRNHIMKAVGATQNTVAVYSPDDEEQSAGTCGVTSSSSSTPVLEPHGADMHTSPPPGRRLLDYNTGVNVIEVALVSDYLYLQARGGAYGRNLTNVASVNVQIMAYVQATYMAASFARSTSIRIKRQFFFSGGDPYPNLTRTSAGEVDENVLLANFTTWSYGLSSSAYDIVFLLTFYDLVGSTIGYAHTSAACTTGKTGLAEGDSTPLQVANTVSHEIGHVLGMSHDGVVGPPDTTSCSASGYVMTKMSSCPNAGLCPFSTCSITSKNAYTAGVNCLYNWTEPNCTDGVWNGNETGTDCGGSCPACTNSTGCLVNNGGCDQICTPLGPAAYVCSCNSSMYLDPITGTKCIADIDQCVSNPCSGGSCTNLIGPGGVYTSFVCNCTSPYLLSILDGVTCILPSCFDRIKDQNEVLIDCGGVCTRSCNCLISNAAWKYSYDQFSLAGAQWRTMWNDTTKYELIKYGAPVRYIYLNAGQWIYDHDLDPSGYYGVVFTGPATPYSGTWQISNGTHFISKTLTFTSCASVASVCGNGVLEGGEICESCAVYSGGVCLQANPCCDSTCMAAYPRGMTCTDQNGLPGGCWDGSCISRGASCQAVTTLQCFGTPGACPVGTGGGAACGSRVTETFSSTSCTSPFTCYFNCGATSLSGTGAIRGFPCSAANGSVYPSVCDGGPTGDGSSTSACVSVASLSTYLTQSPTTRAPATTAPSRTPTTAFPSGAPTQAPTTQAPTFAPTYVPTTAFPSRAPTFRPTTGLPTSTPTGVPTTAFPTRSPTHVPTTAFPTRAPSRVPTTAFPTLLPTTAFPTLAPTTAFPTLAPTTSTPTTSAPTQQPTTGAPSLVPTTLAPTTPVPTASPTTRLPTSTPTTSIPTTLAPSQAPTAVPTGSPTQTPTHSPTIAPTAAEGFLGVAFLPAEYEYFYYGGAALVLVALIVGIACCCKRAQSKKQQGGGRRRPSDDDMELQG